MNWKLKENLRLNKTCSTCECGTTLASDTSIPLCFKEGGEIPDLGPRIKTCLEWRGEK